MIITIELIDSDVKLFGRWASVARTLNKSKALLLDYLLDNEVSEEEQEELNNNIAELDALIIPLNRLHHDVRGKIWEQERREVKQP